MIATLMLALLLSQTVVRNLPLCSRVKNGHTIIFKGATYYCDATTGQWLKVRVK